ncbi:MAG: DUF2357 domain-containing protein [Clostridiales bacterium]|nr:DUF2357 domain-containing protein [Clostridiales bacterium]
MEKSYKDLYNEYKESISSLMEGNDFYEHILDVTERGNNRLSLFSKYFEKNIDLRWVDAIEECIIPLDTIIRNPRKFIVQEEEIVPIERARKITAESVRHLAQHTNLIARVDDDRVTPSQILNVFREESYEIYENRFIYTLMMNLQRFIDARYNVLFGLSDNENMTSLKMESDIANGREKISYKLEISTQSSQEKEKIDSSVKDTKQASAFQRIERIKGIVNEFARSSFINELHGCTPVRPPIMRTNIISKDPNFKACLNLWQFISAYDEVGYEIVSKESNEMVTDETRDELYKQVAVNYMLLKNNSLHPELIKGKVKQRKIKPKILKRLAEEFVIDYDLEEVEIRRIFLDEVKRASKKKIAGEERIKAAINRALESEKARKAAIEARIKAEIQRKKEIEKRKKEREAARIAREKAREKERIAKQKAALKAKQEKEKALAKEKAAKERERARIAKQKAIEAEKLAKAKEKARLQREKERAEKLRALEEEKAAKAKQREKERIERQKAAQLEKERAAKAKQREKERLAREKAAQLEKERAAKAKQREKERLDRLKAAQLEKERAAKAKQRQRERERIAKIKAEQDKKSSNDVG